MENRKGKNDTLAITVLLLIWLDRFFPHYQPDTVLAMVREIMDVGGASAMQQKNDSRSNSAPPPDNRSDGGFVVALIERNDKHERGNG